MPIGEDARGCRFVIATTSYATSLRGGFGQVSECRVAILADLISAAEFGKPAGPLSISGFHTSR